MVMLSLCVGFTLPGMMLLPGSFSGIEISPMPQRGPLLSQRMSLAIFISAVASTPMAPCAWAMASWPASAANLLAALVKAMPVVVLRRLATASPKPLGAFRPVPTAVPPMARSRTPGSVPSMAAIE